MTDLLWLPDACRLAVSGTGRQVHLEPGWEKRGGTLASSVPFVVGHHTGTPLTAANAAQDLPTHNVLVNGRTGLAGPLCNIAMGRCGDLYVIAARQANHAGESAYMGHTGLNDESIGIEAESPGDGTWTAGQVDMWPRVVGALLHYLGRPSTYYASHRTVATPKGRKTDPVGISDEWVRAESDRVRTEGFTDMDAVQDARLKNIELWLGDLIHNHLESGGGKLQINWRGQEIEQHMRALLGMEPVAAFDPADGRPLGGAAVPVVPAGEVAPLVALLQEMRADITELREQLAALAGPGIVIKSEGEIITRATTA